MPALLRILEVLVERAAHPLILGSALWVWLEAGRSIAVTSLVMLVTLVVVSLLECLVPARKAWRLSGKERLTLVGVYAAILVLFDLVIRFYDASLAPVLVSLRSTLGIDVWPNEWPLLAQIALLFFAAEFIYYWIHRALHGSSLLWRASGHGFHHSFRNMHALNVGANHPLELVFLALPILILGALFAATPDAIGGAVLLAVVNGILAHANLGMRTPFFDWFFTSSDQHRRHHSNVFTESNTNFSCNGILWDRLFGTYSSGVVEQTGIGPQEPTLWQKLLLPIREPAYADTAASRQYAEQADTRD